MNEAESGSNTEELLFQYVGLKAQVRALEHEMKALYPEVLRAMKDSD